MQEVAKISIEQHRELFKKKLKSGIEFNPYLDGEGNILITKQEIDMCDVPEFQWVKQLEIVEDKDLLKSLTPEEWLAEDKKAYEEKLLEIDEKLKKDTKTKL